jgi:ribosome-binding protein aMBF1 (putative translation factor)
MPNHSRWEDLKKQRPGQPDEERACIEQGFTLGELIYKLRTSERLSQRELADRMGTTQSVISRLEEGGGGRPRLDTLARVATALDRHLVVSFPDCMPERINDGIRVT